MFFKQENNIYKEQIQKELIDIYERDKNVLAEIDKCIYRTTEEIQQVHNSKDKYVNPKESLKDSIDQLYYLINKRYDIHNNLLATIKQILY